MKEYPLWRAHGYVTGVTTSAMNSDCGVFIEGIKRKRQLQIDTEDFDALTLNSLEKRTNFSRTIACLVDSRVK